MTCSIQFVDTRDISNLLSRAGFTLLTVDIDEVKVAYPSMWELMEDLQDMGEGNAVIGRWWEITNLLPQFWQIMVCRRNLIHRDTLTAASAIYKGGFFFWPGRNVFKLFSEMHGDDFGNVPATFRIIYMVIASHESPPVCSFFDLTFSPF